MTDSGAGSSLGHPEPPARAPLELLLKSAFGAYFFGKLLWATGVWVFTVTSAILMFSLTSSAFMVGVVTFFQYFPMLVLSPVSGARSDRGDPKRQAALGRIIMAVGSTTLVIHLLVTDSRSTLTIGFLLFTALSVGLGDALGAPAAQTLMPALIGRNELATAVELDAIPFTLARAVGPLLGAVITALISVAFAFAYTALVCIIFAVILLRLKPRESVRRRTGDGTVAEGMRYLRTQPILIVLLVGVTAVGFGVDPVVTLSPALVASLGGTGEQVALLASAFGAGAGMILLVLRRIRSRIGVERIASSGLSLLAFAMLLIAFAPDVRTALYVMVLGGMGYSMAITSLTTMLQSRVANEMRGRIMALWSVTYFGSRPIAAAINGAMADLVSVRMAFIFAGLLIVAGAWAVRPSHVRSEVS
jgi:MFS family permease